MHPQGKTRARISKDKENVRNPQANVVKKTIPEDVVIADDSADTKKRKVTASSDKSEKPLKRITKRNTAAPVPGPTHPKQVSEAAAAEAAHATIQRHRANTTSRVKTFSLEEVSKITDMDDEFDEDDMPEVQMPPPSRAAPKPTTKARAAPKPAEAPKPTIVEKATVTFDHAPCNWNPLKSCSKFLRARKPSETMYKKKCQTSGACYAMVM